VRYSDPVLLFLGILFGAVGTGYFIYGKRQTSATYLVTGVLLMIFPYFFSSLAAVLLVGAALAAAPFVIERFA